MSGANQSIVTLYEIEGLTPEQIADAEGWELGAVKSILMQCSEMYNAKLKTKEEDGFSDQEALAARKVIANIAQYGEDEQLRLRAAMYVRNDKKGRLDIAQASKGLNINVTMINAGIQKAIERATASRNRIIELDSNESKLLAAANNKVI